MTIEVAGPADSYEVHLAPGSINRLPGLVEGTYRVAVIHSAPLSRIAHQVTAPLEQQVLHIEVPDAEEAKTPAVLQSCWEQLAAAGFTRNDVVIGVGGGTVTDLAGFVAATWLRGIRFISVPTTVLAMVDAAVGGKTGINLPHGKNLVGAFQNPAAVLCDIDLLATLGQDDARAGMAEVIKCGFISDAAILDLAGRDDALDHTSETFRELVTRAVQVKADVVAADFRESTSQGSRVGREALNYGHTLGHAIEAQSGFTWRHGEAISVGMAWVARVASALLGLEDQVVAQHDELLGRMGLPLFAGMPFDRLRALMGLDKKSRGATLRLVGLESVGHTRIIEGPDEQVLLDSWRQLERLHVAR